MSGLYAAVLIATLFGALTSAGIFVYAWRRRKSPVAATFAALMALISVTCLVYVGMWSSPERDVVYALARTRFIGLALMSVFYLLFVLEYIGLHPWRHRVWVAVLFIIPVVSQAALWTNEVHLLFFRAWDFTRVGPFASEIITYGPAWQLHALNSYACTLIGIGLLLRTALRSTGAYAVQSILMFVGSLLVVLVNIPVAFLLADKPVPNLTPVSYAVAGAIFVFALQRHRLLDIVPVALDVVYNSMDDAVLLMDLQKRVVAANPAALRVLGHEAEQVLGAEIAEAFSKRPEMLNQILLLGDTPGEVFDSGGDTSRYYDLRVSTVKRDHDLTGTVLVLRDITERRNAERHSRQLTLEQEKIRLLSGFIRDTSHDLRTPLTVMNTALYLARKTDDPVRREAKLSEIEQQLNQIQRIIDGLLLLTSLDTAATLDISVFNLGALIEPLPAEVHALIERKNLKLHVDIKDETARGDVTMLRRAVQNLVQNAVLYTPANGSIIARGHRDGQNIVIEVEDNGVGIPEEDLEGIFERFTKVNRARTQDGSGAGLGLAITRKIAQIHNGEVAARSIPGKGSTFKLSFPASQRVRIPARSPAEVSAVSPTPVNS